LADAFAEAVRAQINERIQKQQADYLLSVKDNQPNLKKDIEDYVQDERLKKSMGTLTVEAMHWLLDVHFGEDRTFNNLSGLRAEANIFFFLLCRLNPKSTSDTSFRAILRNTFMFSSELSFLARDASSRNNTSKLQCKLPSTIRSGLSAQKRDEMCHCPVFRLISQEIFPAILFVHFRNTQCPQNLLRNIKWCKARLLICFPIYASCFPIPALGLVFR
jgi:hypothetical protein